MDMAQPEKWYKDLKWNSQSCKDLSSDSGQIRLQLSDGQSLKLSFERLEKLREFIEALESSISPQVKSKPIN